MHNIELKIGKGGQLARTAGSSAQVVAKEGDYVTLRLRSSEMRLVHGRCLATIGEVALSGDIRPVGHLSQRVAEAARLGYRRILVPPGSARWLTSVPPGVAIVELPHLSRALEALAAYEVRR